MHSGQRIDGRSIEASTCTTIVPRPLDADLPAHRCLEARPSSAMRSTPGRVSRASARAPRAQARRRRRAPRGRRRARRRSAPSSSRSSATPSMRSRPAVTCTRAAEEARVLPPRRHHRRRALGDEAIVPVLEPRAQRRGEVGARHRRCRARSPPTSRSPPAPRETRARSGSRRCRRTRWCTRSRSALISVRMPATFLPSTQHVVRPLERRRDVEAHQRLGDRHARGQRQRRHAMRRQRRPQHRREIQALARRRVPAPPEPPASARLLVGDDDRAGRRARARPRRRLVVGRADARQMPPGAPEPRRRQPRRDHVGA